MKNATFLGLCSMATTFGLVAVALGQQATVPGQPWSPAARQGQAVAEQSKLFELRQPADLPPAGGAVGFAAAEGAASGSAAQPTATGAGQQRGELGVWMVESGGPGVEIRRITSGSEAERAGLRAGDIILLVNGRGASSPQATAQMIRQIPIGQSGTLTIWRNGDQQQLQVTMQAARQAARDSSYQVGFRGEGGATSGDLASRTMRLEQQLGAVMQELQQLRQEMAQLRTAGGQSTGLTTEPGQGALQQNSPIPPSSNQLAPPPGFHRPEPNAASPDGGAGTPSATPGNEKAATPDPFGNDPAPPAAEEKPKEDAGAKPEDESDSLFK